MKDIFKYCFWFLLFIIKSVLILLKFLIIIIILFVVSIILIHEFNRYKEAKIIKEDLKKINIDITKYEMQMHYSFWDFKIKKTAPKVWYYHFGIINEKGLKDGVGENYDVWGRGDGSMWLNRWLIGEWNNDTISGPAIEIMYSPGDSGTECIQQIIFSSYPEDTLSNNCFHYDHLPYDRYLNYKIMNDTLTKSARQWATENLNY